MHLYSYALLIFALPLAIASAVKPPMPSVTRPDVLRFEMTSEPDPLRPTPHSDFFCMSTPMLIGPVGLVFLISLFRPKCPFWCSSDAPGTRMKPAFFYMFEDIGAVDFRHGREWRERVNAR